MSQFSFGIPQNQSDLIEILGDFVEGVRRNLALVRQNDADVRDDEGTWWVGWRRSTIGQVDCLQEGGLNEIHI